MAKKPLLDATSRPESTYSAFTKNYRASDSIIDRRGKQYRPTSTNPRGGSVGGGTGPVREDTQAVDDYNSDMAGFGGKSSETTPRNSSRKVDADEAIRRTHTERN